MRGGKGHGGMMVFYERLAYLFATRYQPFYQHRLSLLRIVQLLSELLVLEKRKPRWPVSFCCIERVEQKNDPKKKTEMIIMMNRGRTSSSTFSARTFSPSASCFCSAARARDSSTSSSFDRMTHSKWRSRNSYCRRISLRRARTLYAPRSSVCAPFVINKKSDHVHTVENLFHRPHCPNGAWKRVNGK